MPQSQEQPPRSKQYKVGGNEYSDGNSNSALSGSGMSGGAQFVNQLEAHNIAAAQMHQSAAISPAIKQKYKKSSVAEYGTYDPSQGRQEYKTANSSYMNNA